MYQGYIKYHTEISGVLSEKTECYTAFLENRDYTGSITSSVDTILMADFFEWIFLNIMYF